MRALLMLWALCVAFAGLAVGLGTPVGDEPATLADLPFTDSAYVANGGCTGCHVPKRPELIAAWKASLHAKAAPAPGASGIDLYRRVTGVAADGSYRHAGVGCQMCHGPGARHDESSQIRYILRPQRLSAQRATMVCGQCHATGTSPDGTGVLAGYMPGLDLSRSLTLSPDASGPFARFNEFARTKHATAERLTCTTCHDPHGSETPHSLRSGDPDSLCTSCHGAQPDSAARPCSSGAVGSCVACHMPDGSHDVRASVGR